MLETTALPPTSALPTIEPAAHRLDPLSADEITVAAEVARQHAGLDASAWFESIQLDDFDKATLNLGANGSLPRRIARVCCYEPSSNRTLAGHVDIAERRLIDWHHIEGMQARIVPDEFYAGGAFTKRDPAFIAALALRGITDLAKVTVEPWAAGNFGIEGEAGERIAYGHCWLANDSGDNPYGRPIANLHPVIDLRRGKVVRIDDFGVVPLPPDSGNIALTPAELRQDVKPFVVTQPEGPSFTVEGRVVSWQKWQFHVGFNGREGIILGDIGYHDGGRLRSIMNRASMVEMTVPYGHPTGGNFRRNAFDLGEYGFGSLLDSLKLGCDCLGHIHYFDVWSHDWHGKPHMIANAICMHEEDVGLLWKFSEPGKTSLRARARRLVVSSLATIGNYVYGVFWYFHQDGTFAVEVKATGIPFPTGTMPGNTSAYGMPMAAQIEGHVHQHIFSFRFDMAIDGQRNAVREVNFAGAPLGPDNPHGNAIVTTISPLTSELQAQRCLDLGAARYWAIVNPDKRNAWGHPVGYKLMPGPNAMTYFTSDAPMNKRARFASKHFWATRYAPDELYPAGLYPNQHAGEDGLPAWTAADRPLENENVVVWYTMNYHHLPRPEDWPVQPVILAGFQWMPEGFFDRNPALDVPPPADPGCCATS
jgi:primary-amine oxidase